MGELEDHPLDQSEFLAALQTRDLVQELLVLRGSDPFEDAVDEIDAHFDDLTVENARFCERFKEQAGSGWWWMRLPKNPSAQAYIVRDW